MRKFILIAACFTLSTSIIVNKENVQELEFEPIIIEAEALPAVQQLEFEPIHLTGEDVDIFEIIDDDSINRDEMNKMLDEIWPAASPRPSR